jgi:hypothetical protein
MHLGKTARGWQVAQDNAEQGGDVEQSGCFITVLVKYIILFLLYYIYMLYFQKLY